MLQIRCLTLIRPQGRFAGVLENRPQFSTRFCELKSLLRPTKNHTGEDRHDEGEDNFYSRDD
jgi:hypothetical protein